MGNLCSKKKRGSDTISVKSDVSGHRGLYEKVENHSSNKSNKFDPGTNGNKFMERSSEATPSTAAAQTPEHAFLAKESVRGRGGVRETDPSSLSGDSMSLSSPTIVSPPDLPFPSKLPIEVEKQSETVKNLLLGRVSKIKNRQRVNKITLFVSAPDFRDFEVEKGRLHSIVYPSLRNYASTQGYELHISDMHWDLANINRGVIDEFPEEYSLSELKRQLESSTVIPILFLSTYLGPPLLPKTIEQSDFETSFSTLTDSSEVELLKKWYELDGNAQPQCYRLASILSHIPKLESQNEEDRKFGREEWKETTERILNLLLRIFPTELRDTYLTTVLEQEIQNSVFMSREVAQRTIWIQRTYTERPESEIQNISVGEIEKNRRLEAVHSELKNQLVSENILKFSVVWKKEVAEEGEEYLNLVTNELSSKLRTIIDSIIEDDVNKNPWKKSYGLNESLCSELMTHTLFCQQGAKCCLSFENIVSDIKTYVSSDSKTPLVLVGPSGCGKTSFISRLILQSPLWTPAHLLLFRFIALTPHSSTPSLLLRSIATQAQFIHQGRVDWAPHNVKSYQKQLYKVFSSSPHPILLVLDGIDKLKSLDGNSEICSWLGQPLPSKLKIIISCEKDSSTHKLLLSSIPNSNSFILMPSLNLVGAEAMLTASILQYSHSVDGELQKKLSSKLNSSVLPLFIKVLTWEASIDSPQNLDFSKVHDLSSAIDLLFSHLEKVLGAEKVKIALSLLCGSRDGLTDSEFLDLLSTYSQFHSSKSNINWAPASVFLVQLFSYLGPFLEWGSNGAVNWRDFKIAQAASAKYYNFNSKNTTQSLLNYFQAKGVSVGREFCVDGKWRKRRAVDEIPYQESKLRGSIINSYLLNWEWLIEKLQFSSVFNVISDIELEEAKLMKPSPDLSLLKEVLCLSSESLFLDYTQLYSQFLNRLFFLSKTPSVETYPFMTQLLKHLLSVGSNYPGGSLVPLSTLLTQATVSTNEKRGFEKSTNEKRGGEEELTSIGGVKEELANESGALFKSTNERRASSLSTNENAEEGGGVYFTDIVRMKEGNQFVVTLSTEKEEVSVWDVYGENRVRMLKGVHNPISLRVIDSHRAVILCGRELVVYNLDDGSSMARLKGVMNQKMPYYGLHNSSHIVAISRNRMYVNLMNLSSGDCVTTFKVGEDRFLNSLLVSENGKILVCGDETQKPFPLLVWDLESRKLLYDLRIPHHEFVTRLSAITKEGHFVCSVCREVDDPGPNFIVVYDLQSGTLFKKWKPGVSTQAIAISAQGGCVINALEDNKIIVWDLVTGASQWTLEKHIAPPNVLKLDQKGSRCLSADTTGRDRSLCLWNLANGTLLAIFTPDVPFTACEILNNGDGIVLGLRGRSEIATLSYKGAKDRERIAEKYGSDENHGKITTLLKPQTD